MNERNRSKDVIVVDGIEYWNDRFYLLKPMTRSASTNNSKVIYLDRGRLLSSLDLVGMIACTYSLDKKYLLEIVPSNLPTLILMDSKKNSTNHPQPSSSSSKNGKDDNKRRPTTDSFLQRHSKKRMQSPIFSSMMTTSTHTATHTAAINNTINHHQPSIISNPNVKMYISNVKPSYYDNQTKKRRGVRGGVQHAKYMILFERSGSIIVLISTANLTRPNSIDAAWIQRFYPHNHNQPPSAQKQQHKQEEEKKNYNDFDQVFYNFIIHQSKCIVNTNDSNRNDVTIMTPLKFLQTYIYPTITSLKQWIQLYNFQTAQVFLVSTVPGKFRSNNQQKYTYGARRMRHLLQELKQQSWLPSLHQKQHTDLLFQPTSFGGGQWNRQNLLSMIQSFHAYNTSTAEEEEDAILERIHILWPTMEYMSNISKINNNHNNKADQIIDCNTHAFLSTKAFNEMSLDLLSRMCIYHANPNVVPFQSSIHFKSYLQFLQPENKRNLAWFLLTSACLSKGAQGQIDTENKNVDEMIMSYSNFELGILFVSRLQGNISTDRLYTTMDDEISTNTTCNRIQLPIPYLMKIDPYRANDDVDFTVTPYFHEILPGTETVGQMALTPYGKQKIIDQRKKEIEKKSIL